MAYKGASESLQYKASRVKIATGFDENLSEGELREVLVKRAQYLQSEISKLPKSKCNVERARLGKEMQGVQSQISALKRKKYFSNYFLQVAKTRLSKEEYKKISDIAYTLMNSENGELLKNMENDHE